MPYKIGPRRYGLGYNLVARGASESRHRERKVEPLTENYYI